MIPELIERKDQKSFIIELKTNKKNSFKITFKRKVDIIQKKVYEFLKNIHLKQRLKKFCNSETVLNTVSFSCR